MGQREVAELTAAENRTPGSVQRADRRSGVTFRSLILGVVTIAAMVLYITYYGRNLMKTYLPVAVMLPFVAWVVLNTLLKLAAPRFALRRTEMLTILCVVWMAGNLPGIGWASYMISDISAPAHLASPENRVRDVVMPLFPEWLFPVESRAVVGQLYSGLEGSQPIPWAGWVKPLSGG
jgi:hypothetical protein